MSDHPPTSADRYHALRVKQLVPETDEAVSIGFEIPTELVGAFTYAAGQFVTLRVGVDGEVLFRSYSMSSTPGIDEDLRITVKRVPEGIVSNWINDHLREGETLDVSAPAGSFVLPAGGGGPAEHDVLAFAAGSGITPVFSIVRSALLTTSRRVRLLFANRDRDTAIFGDDLDALAERFADRFELLHHADVDGGFVTAAEVADFAAADLPDSTGTDAFICGPEGFMATAEEALVKLGTDPARINLERFTPGSEPPPGPRTHAPSGTSVTITHRGRTETVAQRGDATILQSARWCGLPAPATCEAGHCATCMALVVEGHAEMHTNDALTPEEVAEGWVLTCQAVPTSDVRVDYDA